MPDLYANKMKEVEEINKEASKYQKEKERLEKLIHSNESRIKNINRASKESALVESITDETEKYDLVHKAIDKIMIFGEGKTSIIIVTFLLDKLFIWVILQNLIANTTQSFILVLIFTLIFKQIKDISTI